MDTDARTPRPAHVVLAELNEVRRHLNEAPPHHGATGAKLQARLRVLERELAEARKHQTRRS